jgi:hypothetical protein
MTQTSSSVSSDGTIPPTRHLRQKELAQRWGVSPRTLERQRWLGVGPRYLKLLGRVAYRLADVEEYEAANLSSPTAASAEAE